MEKVKDLKRGILPPGYILAEIIKPKSRLVIVPNGSDTPDAYMKVISVHKSIEDIKEGDLLIKVSGPIYGWPVKQADGTDKEFCMVSRGSVQFAVTPDNFIDPDDIKVKLTL